MPTLNELIAAVREAGGEYPETFLDDVSTAYTEDMGVRDGKIEAVEVELAALREENLKLKSHNYELIMSGAREPNVEDGTDEGVTDEEDIDEDNEPADNDEDESVDDLYQTH